MVCLFIEGEPLFSTIKIIISVVNRDAPQNLLAPNGTEF